MPRCSLSSINRVSGQSPSLMTLFSFGLSSMNLDSRKHLSQIQITVGC